MYDWNENPIINGIFASRYIASYSNVRGEIHPWNFRKWLESLTVNGSKLSDEDVCFLVNRATIGKLELEENVRRFFDQK